MGIEFVRPYAWLLLPPCVALVLVIDRLCQGRRRGIKRRVARAARVALVFLAVAALAGPAVLMPGSRSAVWALCDLSASNAGRRAAMEDALREGLAHAKKNLYTGAIAFAQNAMVDLPLKEGRTDMPLGAAPAANGTDIGRGLAMALALLPEDAAGRVVLLSDGKDNTSGAAAQLASLKARGIAVDVLPFESAALRDAQVTAVMPPAQVYQGEKFEVSVRVDSQYETKGTLVLYENRQPVSTRGVTLRKGANTFVFQGAAEESGVVSYEADLIAEGDENPRNNRLGAYMDVRGVPRILIVGEHAGELPAMLEAAGMAADTLPPGRMARSAEALRQYHAVALVNVNRDDLHALSIDALDDYVSKLGRGLAVFGGDDSYALGGWRGSTLEDMLPVTMDVDNRLDMPTLALMLVIDKSGSMTEGRYGITRLDMAKEAAMRSAEVLTGRDQVGVIAFDDTAKWVVPLQRVTDAASIQQMIGTIRPGGSTMYYSALSQSLTALIEADAQFKHVIFLTDGEPGDSGYEFVVRQMAQNGITLTTVAVGDGANTALLRRLAEMGGGRTYAAGEFDELPKVFTKETYLATRSYVQNRTFYPVVRADGPLTDYAGFPPLDGYMAATMKPLATIALATDRDEPLLAWWQYGAGRSLAWTSDVSGAWTGGFLAWEQAAAFFAGMISHILPAEEGEGEFSITRQGDTAKLRYAVDAEEEGLTTEALVLMPDGSQARAALYATAPGVYEGVIDASREGAYAVRVEQRRGDTLLRTLESGLTVGYAEEFDIRGRDGKSLLMEIARETGGRMLTDASEMFTERGSQTRGRHEITPALLTVCLLLFVLDVAQRRLAWERWLPAKKQEKRKEENPPRTAAKRGRPGGQENGKPEQVPAATMEKLLEGRKKKLM